VLAEAKSMRWKGTYNGAGELGEGDIKEEEEKRQKGLTSSQKLETELLGLEFAHAMRNCNREEWWELVGCGRRGGGGHLIM